MNTIVNFNDISSVVLCNGNFMALIIISLDIW